MTSPSPSLTPPPRVSVVIATYNRAALLDDCLSVLLTQPFAAGDEVVVVDNGSTDTTAEVIARHRAAFPDLVRGIHEAAPGKAIALQTALDEVSGEVIALTDDDVRVSSGWLTALRSVMTDPSVVLAGGPVLPRWEREAPRWLGIGEGPYGRLASPIALLHYGHDTTNLGSRTLLGANMAIRRDALTALGGFARHLGKLRDTLLSGEDADLCDRVRAQGWRGIYTADAGVQHWVPASRMRVPYYLSWFYWSGITHAALDEASANRGRMIAGVPAWLIRRLASACGRTVAAGLRGRRQQVVEHAIDIAFVCGYAVRRWRLTQVATPAPQSAGRTAA